MYTGMQAAQSSESRDGLGVCARPGAGVSTPLAWDELTEDEDIRQKFTVQTVPQRLAALKKDPWADYARTRHSITEAMWRSVGRK